MAAGLGFKDFTTGEVLTAADVDGYLMQGIWVFANTTARDAAVTAPAEGNFAFTKDTNSLWYYDGAAWVASGATGDIEGVTAGTGISGGGTSGTVTITNSMATAIDAKGDLVAGTGADAFSRLAVGTNDQVLIADSTAATGLKWGTPSSGGMTLLASGSIAASATGIDISSISGSYQDLVLVIANWSLTGTGRMQLRTNNNTAADYTWVQFNYQAGSYLGGAAGATSIEVADSNSATDNLFAQIQFYDYANTTSYKHTTQLSSWQDNRCSFGTGFTKSTSAIDRIQIICNAGTFDRGTYELFGVK